MYTLVDGVEFYDKDEVDDIVRAITGGSLPNEDGIRNELTTKIDAEAAEREQADIRLSTELGARIDEETVAREAAVATNRSLIDLEMQSRAAVDTLLSNQLAAIEQLHTTLIGPNGFVDSDGDTIKANDSGKSIRQIAHEEFYRQLITDADDVKEQLDTLKELANYLQQNPSVLLDMYNKLGITWSLDNPTDFGTFDFSTVLSATNVDDAVLELYNTFNDKIGDLQQLSTTFKGSVVGAINELDSTIRSKTYTDVKTIVFTPTSPDVPPAELNSTTKHFAASTTATFAEVYARLSDDKQSVIAVLEIDKYNKIYASVLQITDASITFCSTSCITKTTDSGATNTYQDTTINWFNDGSADVLVTDDYVAARIDEEAAAREQADTELGTRIDEEAAAREQADTALGTRIGQLDNLKTIDKSSTVAAINELYDTVQQGGGGGGSDSDSDSPVTPIPDVYTFVVDSNDTLTELMTNDKSKGQDYTRVLVKKGEWVFAPGLTGNEDDGYTPSSVYLDPAVSGIKEIAGEDGATITFCNMSYGIFTLHNSMYYCDIHGITFVLKPYMQMHSLFGNISGVHDCNIVVDSRQYLDGEIPDGQLPLSCLGFAFYACHNIDNISITSNAQSENPDTYTGLVGAMISCSNVTNITVDVKVLAQLSLTMESPSVFDSCSRMDGIDVKGHMLNLNALTTGQDSMIVAFSRCKDILNASVSLDIAQDSDFNAMCAITGFSACENVTTSSVAIDMAPVFKSAADRLLVIAAGYAGSKYLKFCSSDVTCTLSDDLGTVACTTAGFIMSDSIIGAISKAQCEGSDAFGFYQCNNVIASNGVGKSLTSGKEGYGFKECTGVSHCIGIENEQSSTATFHQESCCASIGEYSPGSMVSNTAVGGYNDAPTTSGATNTAANCEQFTYVVDSDEALADWANNVEGNDYTSVLIRKGTWTSAVGVNLTTAGTKVVVGEADSKLVFNNVEKGLYYTDIPQSPEYYMTGVTVATSTGSGYGSGTGFYNCSSLTNCKGTGTSEDDEGGAGIGFYNCSNLTNCDGTGIGDGAGFYRCSNLTNCKGTGTGPGYGSGTGFYSCYNLTNCDGIGTSESTNIGYGYGFYSCSNLTNCKGTGTGTGTGTGEGYGFYSCTDLANCTGTGEGFGESFGGSTGTGKGYGFHGCTNLTNCTGTGEGFGESMYVFSSGFYDCTSLTNCIGTGESSLAGYGFYMCYGVSACKAGGNCATGVFNGCYASLSKTSDYACADTPNGGFNNTTNPST